MTQRYTDLRHLRAKKLKKDINRRSASIPVSKTANVLDESHTKMNLGE
jgi:hypothetical protein